MVLGEQKDEEIIPLREKRRKKESSGFRTPWALENEDNWRKTHQLVSKLWVRGGLLITLATLFLPVRAGFIFFICVISIITIIPGIYSYRYFKKHRQS